MTAVIRVDQLCKQYSMGALHRPAYGMLRESLAQGCSNGWRQIAGWARGHRRPRVAASPSSKSQERFWALRDVSFDVQPGEIVGVVGRNGAGKSTFLKILSRITEPSSGRVELRGRVGSLLEVGTGFHPELTGRENLYLNGAILGMGHREVARKFDQIVAFSEIEPFLDTPVKRYSSGMYVRLAFAVAAHLEPDILIIDEVLAVGDAQFQEKCLGRMDEVRRAGRTVLFVSHNMAAVRSLCTRAVLLEKGRVTMNDTTEQVVQHYLQAGRARVCARSVPENAYRITNDRARILHVAVHSLDGAPQYQYCFQQPFQVTFQCELLEDVPDGHFEVSVSTLEGTHILYATTIDGGNKPQYLKRGQHQVNAIVDNILLPREYAIDVGVHCQSGETYDFVPNACGFEVVNIGVDGNDHYPWPTTRGHVRGTANWSSSFQSTTTATRN